MSNRRVVYLLVCALVALAGAQALAQVNRSLQWDMVGVNGSVAQSYTYTVTDNGAPAQPTSATVTCAGTTALCSRPITLAAGVHTIVVTATGNGITATSDPLTTAPIGPADPPKPTNLRLTTVVAVNADGSVTLLTASVEKLPDPPAQ